MNKQVRLARLVELVSERGSLHVDDAVSELGISPATARRDLDELAAQQLIRRTRGGAVANATSGDVPMRYRSAREGAAKSRIADAVAARVRPGEVVAFNGGTTTTMAAYQLGVRFSAEYPGGEAIVTVVTRRFQNIRQTPGASLGCFAAALVAFTMAPTIRVTAGELGILAIFGALNLGLGMALFVTGARMIPSAFAALLGTFETLLGPVWVALVHHEIPGTETIIGGTIVLLALIGYLYSALRKQQPVPQVASPT